MSIKTQVNSASAPSRTSSLLALLTVHCDRLSQETSLGDLPFTMADVHDSVRDKVLAIFRDGFGDLADRLDGSVMATPAMDAITATLMDEHGVDRANDIALHMADWNWDAAFIVALHLYPERFTKDEIDAGLGLFLCHAPNHIREACRLTDTYVWEDWPET